MTISQFLPGVYQADLRVSNCFLIGEESGLFPREVDLDPQDDIGWC